jgi:catechol 2,3-dioxygenase-like lactoylglutathione lyase family enzyme
VCQVRLRISRTTLGDHVVSLGVDRPCVRSRIADLVAYLLSDEGRGLTGQVIRIDDVRWRGQPADSEIERIRMSENDQGTDYANLPAPSDGFLVTLFITVRKIARSRAFYTDVLGGTVVLEENPCIVKLANSWIIMNPGGPPTPDKPDITVVNYEPGDTTSIFLNLRVADIAACYREWSARGATFLTPPIDRGAEIRCYMRDPDGYLIEVGQATGILSGHLAAKRPEDLPG